MQPILTLRRKALRGALGLLGLGAATLLAACATAPAPTPAPRSAEIRVITSGAFTEAYKQLVPLFERESGHKVISSFGASMGNAPDAIPTRLARGEQFDVIILAGPALDGFIKEGKAVAGSRVDLVRSTIGFAVKSGAPKPDISTVPKLKQALLDAKSIAYSASASGTYFSTQLVQKLGIAEQVLPKSKRILSERVGTVVARGDAELGLQQVSELVPIPGIDYIGPLPDEVQQATFFSAGIVTGAKEPEAARALIKFFTSAKAAPVIAKTGLEPVGSK
ncbi:MAG TPA: substrate-binding domain-containing protein [Casimicrobium huifangae]|nr:substrate-binding domain-containing protein [Casimicrobium huifangae]HQD66769.1 substrate-binding domain-containing protein [Casimicrobium huifangae]